MLTVRRVYLYLVSAISLITIAWALIGLTRLILSEGLGQGQIIGLASLLATIIVGLPIFLFHWLMAQRLAASNAEERTAPIRQLYFYVVMAAGATPIAANIYRLVDNGLLALVGGIRQDYYPYDLTAAEHLAAILIWGVIWLYLWRQAKPLSNRRAANLPLLNFSIRRLYLLAFALGGLVTATWGSIGLLRILLQLSTGVVWQTPVANFSAQLIVGGSVWVAHWLLLQQDFNAGFPTEERSVLRKIYLYLAVFVYSVMALSSGTLLLKRLIELALGAPPSGEPLLSQLSLPLPLLLVGAVLWAYHWYILQQDARQAPELPRQAGVRRIYAYLVAAVGLAVLLTGIVGLLTLLVDMLTQTATVSVGYYREQVALFVAMLLVGTPVWLLPWRAMQRLAITPVAAEAAGSATGSDERNSTVRKIYLYFYVLVAALAVFGSVGWFVFHILTALLGADLPADFLTQVFDALVISLLAAGVWLYHWWAIRRDGQLEQQAQQRRLADIAVAVVDGAEGRLGQRIIELLHQELPGLQIKPVGLTPQAIDSMAAQPAGEASVQAAQYVVGSWQALTEWRGKLESGLTVAIPLPETGWVWAGVEPRSADEYARQVVLGLKQAINGEEIRFDRGPELGTIAAIGLGVLLFLCLAGSLISAGVGMFG